ncbi:MAG: hypothetical protein ABJ013_08590 [Halioglobus sp.]
MTNDNQQGRYQRLVEFISTAAMILSLLFLGYNIQRGTAVTSAQAVFTLNNSMNRALREVALDPEAAELFLKAGTDLNSLTPNEMFRYELWIRTFLNANESAWLFYHKGVINAEEYAGWHSGICETLQRPGFSDYMSSRLDTYAEGFIEDINNHCEGLSL